MTDRHALHVNDVVVSKAQDGHQLLIVTADPSDRLSLLFRGHQRTVPYAVARGANLSGRKGGQPWYTADNTTFDYLETFRLDRPGGVALDRKPSTLRPHASS